MKIKIILLLSVLLVFFTVNYQASAQSKPILYFCEKYESGIGEVGQGTSFSSGRLCVMVKGKEPFGLTDVVIHIDKYNCKEDKFTFYKKIEFDLTPDMNYVYFDNKDLYFETSGIYKVFLLDNKNRVVSSGIVNIIPN